MATLEITYWAGTTQQGGNIPARVLSSETVTVTGTSAQSGAAPVASDLVSIVATGAPARFEMGSSPTATAASAYLGTDERIWLAAQPLNKIAGITA
jgi:hypothetical protein